MSLKSRALAALKRYCKRICKAEYPDGTARLLIYWVRQDGELVYTTMPVICNAQLPDKVRRIERCQQFHSWGVNPWTGEKADLVFEQIFE